MCKDHDGYYNPIQPTTTFQPSDTKAECLTIVSINYTIDFRWYYRSNSSKTWVFCYNWSSQALFSGEYYYAGYLLISGHSLYYPRAYKVDVYLDGLFAFSDFFEITNGGPNSPRMCEGVAENRSPTGLKSRFTLGVDTEAYHYMRFDNIAYFDEKTAQSHNFTTIWIQPDGTTYKTHSCSFNDYKDKDLNLNFWAYGSISDDHILINSSTPIGNWRVEVYEDNYYNGTWEAYGPVAVTPFIVGNESVAGWTVMAYLDGDNNLENASIDVFSKMAKVASSPNVNVVAELDRIAGQDEQYGNWTDCKRFKIEKDMTPDPANAIQDLGEVDMGDANTLKDFLNWTVNNYPANHFLLILWDHGTGCIGVCYDVTNGTNTLSLPRLSEAMSGLPLIIDNVLIDACSMTMAEVAYQIRKSANILIGPEGLGYAPAPYDSYLSALANDSSISPTDFAKNIVKDYIDWCLPIDLIPAATMSAIDLTKMTSLTGAIDDFAATLKEEETLSHQQISLARNLTTGYEGPYAYQSGYFFDLYSFAQQVHSQISDEKLRNASSQLMAALSVGSTVVAESHKNDSGSHGLAIFFPNEKADYDSFANLYESIAFAEETLWNELVEYHLSGYSLTVQTSQSNVPVVVDESNYTTTGDGRIQLYFLPGSYTVNVPNDFSTAPDSRIVFVQWSDGNTSNTRAFYLNAELAVRAEYETQYRLVMEANFGTTYPAIGEHWYNASSKVTISATSPESTWGGQYERYVWQGWTQGGLAPNLENVTYITMDGPINGSAMWTHQLFLTVTSLYGSPVPSSGWVDAGTTVSESITSPLSGTTGTQYVCTGWEGTGNAPVSGTSTATNITLNEPSSIQWNWKTRYLLTVRTDPNWLNPQPSISPGGSWYDNYTEVTCTAQQISGYTFQQWSTEGANWDVGVNPINVTMDGPYSVTAHYIHAESWWSILTRTDVIQALFGILGTVLTVVLIGGTWFRSRKRRDIVKAFLAEIDDVYSRLKTDPKKCEEELYTLRNTILKGLTGGRITEDNYDILDKRIDKYVNELAGKN